MDLRQRVNLLNGATAFGLVVARIGRARVRRGPEGLLLAEGYRLGFPTGGAFTIGNVVLTRGTFAALERGIPRVLVHEARHSGQWARMGPMFLPLYVLATGWSWLRSGDRAAHNRFERAAGLADGGYPDAPLRPLGPVLRGLAARLRTRLRPGSRTDAR